MASTAKSIFNALLSLIFIIVMAGLIAGVMFIILVAAFYYTILLFLKVGILAGLAAIISVAAVLFIATYKLIKKIREVK